MSATLPKELSIAARNLAPPPNFLSLASRPDIISFAGGVPDPALFPYETLSAATNAVFADKDLRRSAMQYAPSIGYPGLRIWLQHYMKQLGVHADHDQIIVTNGAQQGLDLIGKMLIDPGDEIAITAPTFFAALETFNVYRPKYLSVPFANGRLDMDAAKSIISRRPKFFYVIPEFQNPTGSSLDLDQRNELIRLCAEHDVLIVEDAAYERLSFDNDRPPSLLQRKHQRC